MAQCHYLRVMINVADSNWGCTLPVVLAALLAMSAIRTAAAVEVVVAVAVAAAAVVVVVVVLSLQTFLRAAELASQRQLAV